MELKKEEIEHINNLLKSEFEKDTRLLEINISSIDGFSIAQITKENTSLNKDIVASYSSSAIHSSNLILKETIDKTHNFNLIIGKHLIIITLQRGGILINSTFSKNSHEFKELNERIANLDNLAIKVNKVIKARDLITAIKESLPNTYWIDIITKEGFSTKLEDVFVSSHIASLFKTSSLMSKENLEIVIINGNKGYIILLEIDKNRILAVGIKESINEKTDIHINRIKKIIKLSFKS